MKMFSWFDRLFVPCSSLCLLLLALAAPGTLSAAEFCEEHSAIDHVPFLVGQTFFDALGRAPGKEGQVYWSDRLEDLNTNACKSANPDTTFRSCERNNSAEVILQILGSPESISKNGNLTSNSAFVAALYRILLRRDADNAGLKTYLSALDSGETRASVVMRFLASEEYRHRFPCTALAAANPRCYGAGSIDPVSSFLAQTGKDILGTVPDKANLASLTTEVTSNLQAMCKNSSATAFSSCDRVIEAEAIMRMFDPTYKRSNPSITDNKAFVTALYKHLLQRAPDAAGLQSHVDFLNQTNDRVGTVYGFLTSDEYRNRFTCYAGSRAYANLGVNGHPLKQPAYSDSGGVSFDEQLSLVQNLGAQWYRFDVEIPATEATLAGMDSLVTKAQAHGIQLLPILMPQIARVREGPSSTYQKAYDAAVNFVNRYKASVHVWELANEEDDISIYRTGDPGWPRQTPQGDKVTDYNPQRYALTEAVLRGLADGVRAADEGALRVINFGGWVHTGFLQKLEDSSVPYDIIGIHWYEFMGEIDCPGESHPCPAQPKYFNVVQRMQAITNGKPMWITETNYTPSRAKIEDMAPYLSRVLKTYSNSPAEYPFQVIIVYELLDEPNLKGDETQAGLLSTVRHSDGTYAVGAPKPAYQAVQHLYRH